jgi:hypothetical protein
MKKKYIFRSKNHFSSQQLLIVASAISGVIIGLIVVIATIQAVKTPIVSVGETALNTSSALTVQAVTQTDARELFSGKIVEKEKGLIIRLQVENKTDSSQPFLPVNQVFLKSADGRIYQMRPIAGVKDPIVGGDIKAHATAVGEVSFMVDDSAQELWLYFDGRWNNDAPLVSALPQVAKTR